jgi:D-3-phosphoglycerate dehydrogenase
VSKPIVVIAEELSPATIEALGPDFEIRQVDGTNRAELLEALKSASAVLIRSATQMDEEAVNLASQLKVIARAGVGLDNVDIKAATAKGVMVVNAPTSNVTSAAELAVGMILSLARHIPAANQSMKQGLWQRSKFNGTELYEKTIGIVGLGRIGALVAARLAGFEAKLIGYDPFISNNRADQLGVELVSLEDLMKQSDFITIHIPKTKETTGLISKKEFALAKPELRIVNASRGGIIDEADLFEALSNKRIAGAALDVYVNEPPKDSPLLALENIVLTPHLGASTGEAQEKAGISVAKSVRLALAGDLVPDAVNVAGGVIDNSVKPGIALMENMGQLLYGITGGNVSAIEVEVRGEIADKDVSILKLAGLKGFYLNQVEEQVSYVNAPLLASARGVEVRLSTDLRSEEYRNVTTIKALLKDGGSAWVSGTVIGPKLIQKFTNISGYDVDLSPAENMILTIYADRPGVVAVYGKAFAENNINIAAMQIARDAKGGKALSVITVDSAVAPEVLEKLATNIQAEMMKAVKLNLA